MQDAATTSLHVRLTSTDRERLNRLVRVEELSASAVVRRLIRKAAGRDHEAQA